MRSEKEDNWTYTPLEAGNLTWITDEALARLSDSS